MKLTEEQEETVRKYVEAQELKLKPLTEDIIDHLCCVLESELIKGKPFDQVLHDAMAELAPNGLIDLDRKTFFLLNHKRIIIMKKLMFVISCVFVFLVALGGLFKIIHWPGASELLMSSSVLLIILVVLFAFDRYKVALARAWSERLTVVFGAIAAVFILAGGFFKTIHWPFAGELLLMGLAVLLLSVPLLFFTVYKNSAT